MRLARIRRCDRTTFCQFCIFMVAIKSCLVRLCIMMIGGHAKGDNDEHYMVDRRHDIERCCSIGE